MSLRSTLLPLLLLIPVLSIPAAARPGISGFDPDALGRSIIYPVDAVLNGREGSVLMRVLVQSDGSVSRIEWRQGDDTVLASSAFRALIDFRFSPSGRDSEREENWVYIPIRFSLQPSGPDQDTAGRPIVNVTPRIRTRSGAPALSPQALKNIGTRRPGGKDTALPTVSKSALRKNLYYPDMARFNRLEGKVVVHALVDQKGHVSNAYAILSDNRIFDDPAVEAVRKATFTPGTIGGKSTALWTLVPIEFLLDSP